MLNNLTQVHATDEDKGVNGQVKYSIVQQPNQKGTKFTVNEETGEVSTNKVILYWLLLSTLLFIQRLSYFHMRSNLIYLSRLILGI